MSIKKIESISQIESFFSYNKLKTLLLFDVGDVLLITECPLFHKSVKNERDQIRKNILDSLGEARFKQLWSRILINEKRHLVESQAPAVIKNLQNIGTKVMALTALQTGSFGEINNMEDWRLSHLSEHGINFSLDLGGDTGFLLDELNEDGFCPVYKKGALFTYTRPKGQVLQAFLKRISWQPEHIIFVDDKEKNIENVAIAADLSKIPFTGLHYQNSTNMNTNFNKDEITKRLNHLIEHGEWV